jgi:hypothetical protein
MVWVEAMNEKVVTLVPKEMGADFRLDTDAALERMKGKTFSRLLVIGDFEDGSMEIESNCNSGEALFLIERAKHHIVFGDGE